MIEPRLRCLRDRTSTLTCVVLASAVACGSEPLPATGFAAAGYDGGKPTDTASPCAAGQWLHTVTGRIVDTHGAPVASAKAQLCLRVAETHALMCVSPADTNSEGHFEIGVPSAIQCVSAATLRTLPPQRDSAPVYCPLSLAAADGIVRVEPPYVAYLTSRAPVLPALGDPAVARTVHFADGLDIEVTPAALSAGTGGYEALASVQVRGDADGLCFLGDAPTPERVYGFSPESDMLGRGFRVRMANATALPPGTTVELRVLGGLSCKLADGEVLSEGQWHPFGTGAVTPDGAYIESDTPLPCLTWLGYAPVP